MLYNVRQLFLQAFVLGTHLCNHSRSTSRVKAIFLNKTAHINIPQCNIMVKLLTTVLQHVPYLSVGHQLCNGPHKGNKHAT